MTQFFPRQHLQLPPASQPRHGVPCLDVDFVLRLQKSDTCHFTDDLTPARPGQPKVRVRAKLPTGLNVSLPGWLNRVHPLED